MALSIPFGFVLLAILLERTAAISCFIGGGNSNQTYIDFVNNYVACAQYQVSNLPAPSFAGYYSQSACAAVSGTCCNNTDACNAPPSPYLQCYKIMAINATTVLTQMYVNTTANPGAMCISNINYDGTVNYETGDSTTCSTMHPSSLNCTACSTPLCNTVRVNSSMSCWAGSSQIQQTLQSGNNDICANYTDSTGSARFAYTTESAMATAGINNIYICHSTLCNQPLLATLQCYQTAGLSGQTLTSGVSSNSRLQVATTAASAGCFNVTLSNGTVVQTIGDITQPCTQFSSSLGSGLQCINCTTSYCNGPPLPTKAPTPSPSTTTPAPSPTSVSKPTSISYFMLCMCLWFLVTSFGIIS